MPGHVTLHIDDLTWCRSFPPVTGLTTQESRFLFYVVVLFFMVPHPEQR